MNGLEKSLLEVKGISKKFGGVLAIDNLSFSLRKGEILGIVGDNGAGKSTLVKIISGFHKVDSGEIFFDGKDIRKMNSKEIREIGIETIFQDLALADNLDSGSNIFLGREPVKNRFLNTKDQIKMVKESAKTLEALGFKLPNLKRLTKDLSGGQRQAVAIARAVHWNAKLLILDEPTAALGVAGRRKVYRLVEDSREKNVSVIYLTPNIKEIFQMIDRVIVLRRGRGVAMMKREDTTINEIAGYIVGSL